MRSNDRVSTAIAAAATVAALAAGTARAANLLSNASFETVGPAGASTSFTGYAGGGHSAAAGWGVFNNTEGTTSTELVASAVPGGNQLMLHVTTDGGANGVSQVFLPIGTGPACVHSGVWVYVVSGQIYIGAGNGGNTGPNAYSTTTGAWEYIEGDNIVCPANTFIIYSSYAVPGGAEFYVDLASVEEFACTGPAGDLDGNGIIGFGDLIIALSSWGPCGPSDPCDADIDGDGTVGFVDMLMILSTWGTCD
jgi:hypothetical protein